MTHVSTATAAAKSGLVQPLLAYRGRRRGQLRAWHHACGERYLPHGNECRMLPAVGHQVSAAG